MASAPKLAPKRSFICVQCPLFCERGDEYKIERLLSGFEKNTGARSSLRKNPTAPLSLKLRQQDAQCHAIESTPAKCKRRLLLRVKYTKGSRPLVSVLGNVVTSHTFNSLADFQLINDALAIEPAPFTAIAPYDLIPRQFSCVRAPTDCSALSLKMAKVVSGPQKTKRKLKHQAASGAGPAKKRGKANVNEEGCIKLDELLKGLFDERPIWAKYAIRIRCDEVGVGGSQSRFHKTLRLIADYQKSGPWSGAWVKRGFKPKARVQSAMYQMINSIAIPPALEHRMHTLLSHCADVKVMFMGQRITTKRFSCQLCDMPESVQRYINTANRLHACDSSTGWFHHSVLKGVRELLAPGIETVIRKAEAESGLAPVGASVVSTAPALTPNELYNRMMSGELKRITVGNVAQNDKHYNPFVLLGSDHDNDDDDGDDSDVNDGVMFV